MSGLDRVLRQKNDPDYKSEDKEELEHKLEQIKIQSLKNIKEKKARKKNKE